jgi:hypothetical protein
MMIYPSFCHASMAIGVAGNIFVLSPMVTMAQGRLTHRVLVSITEDIAKSETRFRAYFKSSGECLGLELISIDNLERYFRRQTSGSINMTPHIPMHQSCSTQMIPERLVSNLLSLQSKSVKTGSQWCHCHALPARRRCVITLTPPYEYCGP